MKKPRASYKHIVAILFCGFAFLCGLMTVVIYRVELFDGLYRGYIKSPEDSNIFEKISNGLNRFGDKMNEYFVFHDMSINAYGAVQKGMDKHLIDDADPKRNVVKLNNDYLTFRETENTDYTELRDYVFEIKERCDAVGADFLYVKRLEKSTKDIDCLPDFYPYRFTSNFPQIKNDMVQGGINVLDLNDAVEAESLEKYSLFYRTDHHWKTETGLWAANLIADKLNEDYQMGIDKAKLDISDYIIEEYDQCFLGSQGIRTGEWFTERDDFHVIYPGYKTNMILKVRNKEKEITGDFSQTIFGNYSYDDGYDMYLTGKNDLLSLTNLEPNNGKYAVCVSDSFGNTVIPFLAQTFERIDNIDLRYFENDLGAYIEENKPDVVIYMLNWTNSVLNEEAY